MRRQVVRRGERRGCIVWWDVDNIRIPDRFCGRSGPAVFVALQEQFRAYLGLAPDSVVLFKFYFVGRPPLPASWRQILRVGDLIQVPPGKQSADLAILQSLISTHAVTLPGMIFFIVSDDSDFGPAIDWLVCRGREAAAVTRCRRRSGDVPLELLGPTVMTPAEQILARRYHSPMVVYDEQLELQPICVRRLLGVPCRGVAWVLCGNERGADHGSRRNDGRCCFAHIADPHSTDVEFLPIVRPGLARMVPRSEVCITAALHRFESQKQSGSLGAVFVRCRFGSGCFRRRFCDFMHFVADEEDGEWEE